MAELTVPTKQKRQVVDLTDRISDWLADQGADNRLCHVFVQHTTAAISTADLDPGTDLDMLDAFEEMVPKLEYRHPHDPSHAPDHIISTLIGPGVSVPVEDGKLTLGTWQRIVLFEFDGPRERFVSLRVS